MESVPCCAVWYSRPGFSVLLRVDTEDLWGLTNRKECARAQFGAGRLSGEGGAARRAWTAAASPRAPSLQPSPTPAASCAQIVMSSGPSNLSGPVGSDRSGGGGGEQEGSGIPRIDPEDVLAAADFDPLLPGACRRQHGARLTPFFSRSASLSGRRKESCPRSPHPQRGSGSAVTFPGILGCPGPGLVVSAVGGSPAGPGRAVRPQGPVGARGEAGGRAGVRERLRGRRACEAAGV